MSREFLANTKDGKAIYKGDKVYSYHRNEFVIAVNRYIDSTDDEVYLEVDSGGVVRPHNCATIAQLKG